MMSDRPHVPGPEDPSPADVPRGEAEVAPAHPESSGAGDPERPREIPEAGDRR